MISGWILLYKEYFIPSLFAIIDRFSCTEDVAGGIVLAIATLLPGLIQEVVGLFFVADQADQEGHEGQADPPRCQGNCQSSSQGQERVSIRTISY